MRWKTSELTHPSTGNLQYSFTNLKIYHAYEISTTLTKMTKMQGSEIEQLDNKSFNRWCEVSLPKVYLFFCFDLFAGFFCKCSA